MCLNARARTHNVFLSISNALRSSPNAHGAKSFGGFWNCNYFESREQRHQERLFNGNVNASIFLFFFYIFAGFLNRPCCTSCAPLLQSKAFHQNVREPQMGVWFGVSLTKTANVVIN